MTKFILQGGGRISKVKLQKILAEIRQEITDRRVKILIIPFARKRSEWKKVYLKYCKRYSKLFIGNEVILASPETTLLRSQINSSDIIFVCGGNELLLKRYLKSIKPKLFNNKVIVGVSAGANVFSSYYYSNDRNRIEKGLGILPIKTMCHYNLSKKEKFKKLISHKNKLRNISLAIKEKDYIILFIQF
jgi:peptidase E